MRCRSLLTILLLLIASESTFAQEYEVYKSKVEQCITAEKQKEPLSASELSDLTSDDVAKYILVLKDIRIQRCSGKEELEAMASEISSSESLSSVDMKQKYLSVYIKSETNSFSPGDKKKLNELDNRLRSRSLEVNLLSILDDLKKQ